MPDLPAVPVPSLALPGLPCGATAAERLASAYVARLRPGTRAAYDQELRAVARWLGLPSAMALMDQLVTLRAGQANELVVAWVGYLRAQGRAPATINRSLSALRSLTKVARKLELIGNGIAEGEADDPAGIADHEGHLLCGDRLRSADEIPFILAVLIVDHDDEPAFTEGRESLGDCSEG